LAKKGGLTVANQNIGFRFDIYERVHLPEGTMAIHELEEIELTPYIQGIPGHEQTQLRGNLQLTAVYESSQEGAGKQTFIHRIPVEISLPVRTDDVSNKDIQVKIDHFDVEVVSDRSLNVTGVLSLAGWEQSRADTPDDDLSDFYAEHQAAEEEWSEANVEPLEFDDESFNTDHTAQKDLDFGQEVIDETIRKEQAVESASDVEEITENEAVMEDTTDKKSLEPEPEPQPEQAIAAKNDMKVAIKLHSYPDAAKDGAKDSPDKSEKANNSLEWKRLFLTNEEKVQFKKLRMCIVQKEDTMQTIADRYQLNPREISLYNRLGEIDISEGQIIYIP
jgi:stage VI sporulation protein D